MGCLAEQQGTRQRATGALRGMEGTIHPDWSLRGGPSRRLGDGKAVHPNRHLAGRTPSCPRCSLGTRQHVMESGAERRTPKRPYGPRMGCGSGKWQRSTGALPPSQANAERVVSRGQEAGCPARRQPLWSAVLCTAFPFRPERLWSVASCDDSRLASGAKASTQLPEDPA